MEHRGHSTIRAGRTVTAVQALMAGAALVLAACAGGDGGNAGNRTPADPVAVAPPGIYRGAAAVLPLRFNMAVTADGRYLGYVFDTPGSEKAHSVVAGQGRSQDGVWRMTVDRAFGCAGSQMRPHVAVQTRAEGRRRNDRLHITWTEEGRTQTIDLAVPQETGPAPGLAAGKYSGDATFLFHQIPEGHMVPAELELTLAADGKLAGRCVNSLSSTSAAPNGLAHVTGTWQAHPDLAAYELTLAFTSPDRDLANLLGGRSFKGMAMPDPYTGALLRYAVLSQSGTKPDMAIAGKVSRNP
jgi:hypothetical protein